MEFEERDAQSPYIQHASVLILLSLQGSPLVGTKMFTRSDSSLHGGIHGIHSCGSNSISPPYWRYHIIHRECEEDEQCA